MGTQKKRKTNTRKKKKKKKERNSKKQSGDMKRLNNQTKPHSIVLSMGLKTGGDIREQEHNS